MGYNSTMKQNEVQVDDTNESTLKKNAKWEKLSHKKPDCIVLPIWHFQNRLLGLGKMKE